MLIYVILTALKDKYKIYVPALSANYECSLNISYQEIYTLLRKNIRDAAFKDNASYPSFPDISLEKIDTVGKTVLCIDLRDYTEDETNERQKIIDELTMDAFNKIKGLIVNNKEEPSIKEIYNCLNRISTIVNQWHQKK